MRWFVVGLGIVFYVLFGTWVFCMQIAGRHDTEHTLSPRRGDLIVIRTGDPAGLKQELDNSHPIIGQVGVEFMVLVLPLEGKVTLVHLDEIEEWLGKMRTE